MKILIITVAGSSTRFSKSIGRECLKCIYSEEGLSKSLLYRMLKKARAVDKVIIVGGYKFEELQRAIAENPEGLASDSTLVYNPKYVEYGSGYSLALGIEESLKYDFDELIFAEGDLFVDDAKFNDVLNSDCNVITINNQPISSDKSVVLYTDAEDKIHYLYDINHKYLEIKEPFKAVYNSGQIWKFVGKSNVKKAYAALSESDKKGTNLVFIQKYFEALKQGEYAFINFDKWINCNTVEDYKKITE